MKNISLSERLASAFIGAIFGAVIGFIMAWLLGVYSQTLGPGQVHVSIAKWIGTSACIFALIGLLIGQHIATMIGNALTALLEFETIGDNGFPSWWKLIILLVVIGGGWLWLK
ncbi:hypothetical protein [Iodobacter sp.]|uniref:hypothetical protein n=1 Tax=Iodobacter sp. TaxID=1915058 RepID=UPI0025EEB1CA|nr:hypothetical protein [Iodobacter sp.]